MHLLTCFSSPPKPRNLPISILHTRLVQEVVASYRETIIELCVLWVSPLIYSSLHTTANQRSWSNCRISKIYNELVIKCNE